MIKIKNIYNNLILVLSIALSVIVFYISFRTLATAQTVARTNHDSIDTFQSEVGMFDYKDPIEVTYSALDSNAQLKGISNAELIYEYIDGSGKPYYKALFSKNVPNKSHPIASIDPVQGRSLPKLKYVDSKNLPKSYKRIAKTIFVTLCFNLSSNFIYEDGLYYHYRDESSEIDRNTLKPVSVSNVIVQFVNPETKLDSYTVNGSGKGYLFCGGKVIEIQWEKEKTNPIKIVDESGSPVSLIKGSTWWILLPQNSSVAYN